MHAKVFNLVQGNGLVLGGTLVRRLVFLSHGGVVWCGVQRDTSSRSNSYLGVGAERADLDLARGDGAMRVDLRGGSDSVGGHGGGGRGRGNHGGISSGSERAS